ncbi:MAG: hypothetical protein WCS89_00760 [Candidatus Paceibacterota bacterium]|jgi:hypothetical protein
MASFSELVELFEKGELGKLLASTFNGECGPVYRCNEDPELLVKFSIGQEAPQVDLLRMAIEKYYMRMGYFLVFNAVHNPNQLEFFVFFQSKGRGSVNVTITINNHPTPVIGQGYAILCSSLRVTSKIFEP